METTPSGWVIKNQIKTSQGFPIEFENHGFMRDLYNDMSPLQVWLKPPQIGATECQIIKTLWCAKKMGWDIIYTLPTATDVNDMAGGKINRIIAQNPILGSWTKDHDTVDQKAVGNNIINYRGTFSQKQAMMVASNLNVHDEVDASDASVIQQYETRLMANPIEEQRRWYFSHPSIAGFGVDIYWQQSDKKEWFITCDGCKAEQVLSFPENINSDTRQYVCSECKKELTDQERINGEWFATSSGDFSGYHISQLMCSWISADKILKDYEDPNKTKQYFTNYVLGLPYVGSDNTISSQTVLKNCTPTVNDQSDRVIIGVDTGLPIYYTMMNKQGVFFHGTCKDPKDGFDPYAELEGYLRRWKNSIIVADQGGDLVGIRQLQAKYPGRVFIVYYRKDRKTNEVAVWGEGEKNGEIVVDRNRMFQLMVEQLRDLGRIPLNGSIEDWTPWAQQFDNVFRTVKETPFGNEYVWERNGPDHFCHTLLYAMVGMDRFGEAAATIIKLHDASMPKFRRVGRTDGIIRGNELGVPVDL